MKIRLPKIRWIIFKAVRVLAKRLFKGKKPWAWHHRQIKNNPPYERILIQGIAKALHQEKFIEFVIRLAKTVVELGRHIKHGTAN